MKSLLKPSLWESISDVSELTDWILQNLKTRVFAATGFFSLSIYETEPKMAEMTKNFSITTQKTSGMTWSACESSS